MVSISEQVIRDITIHTRQQLPNEGCGYLAGIGENITNYYPMKNMDQSPVHFSFDPAEQFEVIKKVRDNNLEIIANVHSHPVTPARPSVEDIRLAYDSTILYAIISFASIPEELKIFKIVNGEVTPIEFIVK